MNDCRKRENEKVFHTGHTHTMDHLRMERRASHLLHRSSVCARCAAKSCTEIVCIPPHSLQRTSFCFREDRTIFCRLCCLLIYFVSRRKSGTLCTAPISSSLLHRRIHDERPGGGPTSMYNGRFSTSIHGP